MNERTFSLDANVMDGLPGRLSKDSAKQNRFHHSHAVWQLARMGAYNTAGELPLAIRLENTGELSELYPDHERIVAILDTSDTDLGNSEILCDILLGFAFRMAKLPGDTPFSAHLISSSKSLESAPESLNALETAPLIKENLVQRLHKLTEMPELFSNGRDPESLAESVINNTTLEYHRRRQGRLGDDSLWGKELDALKILQEAGIDGNDLSLALETLVNNISHPPADDTLNSLFDRNRASLLIRDFQRRAHIQMPGIQVIDERFLKQKSDKSADFPRLPAWNHVFPDNQNTYPDRPDCSESLLKWARRAAVISGRGLLPVFFIDGNSGNGKSILLKQIARRLYEQGFAVVEILDMHRAAIEAENLATSAAAMDAPLILIWDDPRGPGYDPIPDLRELAEAQVSGIPIAIIAVAPEFGYNPKLIRRIPRTVFEVFEIQSMSDDEEVSTLQHNVKTTGETTLPDLVKQTWKLIEGSTKGLAEICRTIAVLGVVGIPAQENLLKEIHGEKKLTSALKFSDKQNKPIIRSLSLNIHDSETVFDLGHEQLVRELWRIMAVDEAGTLELLDKISNVFICEKSLHHFAPRFLTNLRLSPYFPESVFDHVCNHLETLLSENRSSLTCVLTVELFRLINPLDKDSLDQIIIDILAEQVRAGTVDSYLALIPLLRNNLGGIEDTETLKSLNVAIPSLDRVAFKFLLKYLGDHLSNERRQQAVEDARTAAARAPDEGYAVAAYLHLVWHRGTDEQKERAIQETRSWLETTPDDRVVRRAFLDYVIKEGDDGLKRQIMEPLNEWLDQHPEEGPLRKGFLELADILNNRNLLDRVLEKTAVWIDARGNNKAVRSLYFRKAEQRNDKKIIVRACHVALSWLKTHEPDRDTIRSLLFLAGRSGEPSLLKTAMISVFKWLEFHVHEKAILEKFMSVADRSGQTNVMTHAVILGMKFLEENPDNVEMRKTVLGMAARKIDKKIQNRVYDDNVTWLGTAESPPPMMEYLVGRLGVRAGVARRAIPLLERAAAKEKSNLHNHARLWLGSAYRISGDYDLAKSVWEKVASDEDPAMQEKARKNLDSLDTFIKQKFPRGFPPPEEKPVRPSRPPRPPRKSQPTPGESGDRRREEHRRPGRPGRPDGFQKDRERERPRRKSDRKRDFQKTGKNNHQTSPRPVATLGDLLKLKGLDLGKLTKSTESDK